MEKIFNSSLDALKSQSPDWYNYLKKNNRPLFDKVVENAELRLNFVDEDRPIWGKRMVDETWRKAMKCIHDQQLEFEKERRFYLEIINTINKSLIYIEWEYKRKTIKDTLLRGSYKNFWELFHIVIFWISKGEMHIERCIQKFLNKVKQMEGSWLRGEQLYWEIVDWLEWGYLD